MGGVVADPSCCWMAAGEEAYCVFRSWSAGVGCCCSCCCSSALCTDPVSKARWAAGGVRCCCSCCRSNVRCGGPVEKVQWGGCCSRGQSIGLILQLGPSLGRSRAGSMMRRPFWWSAVGERVGISFLEVCNSAPRTGFCSNGYLALMRLQCGVRIAIS